MPSCAASTGRAFAACASTTWDTSAAARLVAEFGDRVVWGNDWPHPNHAGAVPDDDQLVAQIHRMAPTAAALQRLMVDNPQRLYRFDT
jgi:2-pyrone-4,6-dicarboxylate lactonase